MMNQTGQTQGNNRAANPHIIDLEAVNGTYLPITVPEDIKPEEAIEDNNDIHLFPELPTIYLQDIKRFAIPTIRFAIMVLVVIMSVYLVLIIVVAFIKAISIVAMGLMYVGIGFFILAISVGIVLALSSFLSDIRTSTYSKNENDLSEEKETTHSVKNQQLIKTGDVHSFTIINK